MLGAGFNRSTLLADAPQPVADASSFYRGAVTNHYALSCTSTPTTTAPTASCSATSPVRRPTRGSRPDAAHPRPHPVLTARPGRLAGPRRRPPRAT
ncbi:beta-1,3-glucanase family protein [Frankia sp. Cpl3]|nr:beta-1,3-glucanase family protein [Parafrankia colletiae]MCK9904843.1 beta-1,3-glucanase family protein [Frankia sp. Cpl3]